jgi:glycosyltransferase involved in cell wall biosynthesis
MPKTKIVFLSRRVWPEVGGVENHLYHICAHLQKSHSITVISEQSHPGLKRDEVHDGVRYVRIPVQGTTGSKQEVWSWLKEQFSFLAEADTIHVHDVFFWLYPFVPRLLRKPLFITFHGYEGKQPSWKQRLWHQCADFLSDNNICIGSFHQKWYQVEPGVVCYGGVSEILSRPRAGREKVPRTMVFIGRLAEDTGILPYLNALVILPAHRRPQLDVFGDGPLRETISMMIQAHHLPVTLKGVKLWSVAEYQKYDVAVVSGYLTILSALAAGVPVIATYQTDLKRDYLQNTPFAQWIRIAGSVEDLAMMLGEKVTLPFDDAAKWVAQQTWENIAEKYVRLWNEKN